MQRDPRISRQDWEHTPPAVRTTLFSLRHQFRLLEIRCSAYQQEVAVLRQAAAQLKDLKTQIASFENELAYLRQQVLQVEDLKAEIAELRKRLRQNSRNSHRPPSTDPPAQKGKPESEPRGRKFGGQPGHQGHSRQLKPVDDIDQVVELRPVSCAQCGHLLLGADPEPERHQVSELPRMKAEIIAYRLHTLRCLVCGAENKSAWPAEVPQGAIGPGVQATIGYLTGRLGASQRDVVEVMEVLHGLAVSLGSVTAI